MAGQPFNLEGAMSNEGYPEFQPPEGWQGEGEEGEALVKWRRKPDGNICITEFDGVALATGDETSYQTADEELDEMSVSLPNQME